MMGRVQWVSLLLVCSCGRVAFDPRSDPTPSDVTCPVVPSLIACFPLDGDVADHSAHGNDATASNIAFVPGVDADAVEISPASRVDVISSSLSTTRYTADAWIRPSSITARQSV